MTEAPDNNGNCLVLSVVEGSPEYPGLTLLGRDLAKDGKDLEKLLAQQLSAERKLRGEDAKCVLKVSIETEPGKDIPKQRIEAARKAIKASGAVLVD